MELGSALRNVLLGATLLGAVGGVVGSFALLRRQSLLGDALAHAALPGVCIAFLITGGKNPLTLLVGALIAGVLGSLTMVAVVRGTRVKEDAAIGIVLSVFFGVGIVLLTAIQRMPGGNQSGLDRYLFGQAATMVADDVQRMAVLSALVLIVVLALYKEFKLLAFDPEFGRTLGLPMRAIEIAQTTLIVVVVVVGLQMVGVILMVATLVTPAAAARQWTERLGVMLALAALFGAAAGASGAVVSAVVDDMPTGPTIVVVASALLMASLLFAPSRGIVWQGLRARRLAARIRVEHVLKDLYRAGESDGRWDRPVAMDALGRSDREQRALGRAVGALVAGRLARRTADGLRLTGDGARRAAQVVRKHRLWEVYLTRRLELADDHVHRDADDMEHALSDDAVEALDATLGHPDVDPHGQPIPRPDAPREGAA